MTPTQGRYDADDGKPQPESIAEAAVELRGLAPELVRSLVDGLDCRIVLTAHPSDATRRAVLYKQQSVERALEELDRNVGATRRRRLLEEVREALATWWQTDEVRRIRPDAAEEVRRTLFFFESVLFDAAAEAVIELERRLGLELARPPLSFGSWAGADMDGNPAVTPDVIRATAREQRLLALRLLRERVRRLTRLYTQSDVRTPGSAELEESLRRDLRELPSAAELGDRFRHEPLRLKLYLAWHRLGLAEEEARGGAPRSRTSACGRSSRRSPPFSASPPAAGSARGPPGRTSWSGSRASRGTCTAASSTATPTSRRSSAGARRST